MAMIGTQRGNRTHLELDVNQPQSQSARGALFYLSGKIPNLDENPPAALLSGFRVDREVLDRKSVV